MEAAPTMRALLRKKLNLYPKSFSKCEEERDVAESAELRQLVMALADRPTPRACKPAQTSRCVIAAGLEKDIPESNYAAFKAQWHKRSLVPVVNSLSLLGIMVKQAYRNVAHSMIFWRSIWQK